MFSSQGARWPFTSGSADDRGSILSIQNRSPPFPFPPRRPYRAARSVVQCSDCFHGSQSPYSSEAGKVCDDSDSAQILAELSAPKARFASNGHHLHRAAAAAAGRVEAPFNRAAPRLLWTQLTKRSVVLEPARGVRAPQARARARMLARVFLKDRLRSPARVLLCGNPFHRMPKCILASCYKHAHTPTRT